MKRIIQYGGFVSLFLIAFFVLEIMDAQAEKARVTMIDGDDNPVGQEIVLEIPAFDYEEAKVKARKKALENLELYESLPNILSGMSDKDVQSLPPEDQALFNELKKKTEESGKKQNIREKDERSLLHMMHLFEEVRKMAPREFYHQSIRVIDNEGWIYFSKENEYVIFTDDYIGRKIELGRMKAPQPVIYHVNGLAHLDEHINRLVSSPESYASIIAIFWERGAGLSLRKMDGGLTVSMIIDKREPAEQEKKMRDFFSRRGILPSSDYLTADGTRILEHPLPDDGASVIEICHAFLAEFHGITPDDAVEISYGEERLPQPQQPPCP